MSVTETLDTIHKTIAGLLESQAKAAPEEVTMTPAEFLDYAIDQVQKARTDDGVDVPRLQHLLGNIEAVKKMQGAFDKDGASISVYSGPLARQSQTAASEESEKTQSFQAAHGSTAGTMQVPTTKAEAAAVVKSLAPMFQVTDARELLLVELKDMLEAIEVEKAEKEDTEKAPPPFPPKKPAAGEGEEEDAEKGGKKKEKGDEPAKKTVWPFDLNEKPLDESLQFNDKE